MSTERCLALTGRTGPLIGILLLRWQRARPPHPTVCLACWSLFKWIDVRNQFHFNMKMMEYLQVCCVECSSTFKIIRMEFKRGWPAQRLQLHWMSKGTSSSAMSARVSYDTMADVRINNLVKAVVWERPGRPIPSPCHVRLRNIPTENTVHCIWFQVVIYSACVPLFTNY